MLTQDRSARGKNVMVEQMKVSRITLQWAGSKMGSKSSGDSPQKSEVWHREENEKSNNKLKNNNYHHKNLPGGSPN